jgi:proliferating cell nuclear antigen
MSTTVSTSINVDDAEIQEKYKMFFITTQSHPFKTMIDSLKDIINDVVFNVSKNGLQMECMDESIMLVTFTLAHNKFPKFYCEHAMELGLNLQSLFKLIKCIDTGDNLIMYVNRNDETRLHIIIESHQRNMIDRSYLKLLDFYNDDLQLNTVKYDCQIDLPTNEFQRIIKDFYSLGEHLRIRTDLDGSLTLSVEGDIGGRETTMHGVVRVRDQKDTAGGAGDASDNKDAAATEEEEDFVARPVDQHFSLVYISKFVKCTNLCINLKMHLTQNYPMVLIYSVGDLGTVKFLLSPLEELQT